MGRVRRNVVFDVFGSVVAGRQEFHKSAKKADAEYSELSAWIFDDNNAATIAKTLGDKIAKDRRNQDDALSLLAYDAEVTS
jgi:hypothetical protein